MASKESREKEFEEKKKRKKKECYFVAAKRDKMQIVTEGKKLKFL